ncbi:MAG: mannose-6-phosphate isomerase, class I [Spirochaeta sp.]
METSFYHLVNPVKQYAWGSLDKIARFQHRSHPTQQPEAEVWMGAHPSDSSLVVIHGRKQSLFREMQQDPDYWLGPQVQARYGIQFPYLLKLLAADKALSIQVHPSRIQAERGFAIEERNGVPLNAPHRTYRDANHKPEMMVAQSEFWAMCGFRSLQSIQRLFRPLHHYIGKSVEGNKALLELWSTIEKAEADTQGHDRFFRSLMAVTMEQPAAAQTLLEAGRRAARKELRELDPDAADWIEKLYAQFPGDPGALAPLYLNLIRLQPGESLALRAGIPHAYLHGLGIEIMANSDNVIRAGLTVKHIDVPALVETCRCEGMDPNPASPVEILPGVEEYPRAFEEFSLIRIHPGNKVLHFNRNSPAAAIGPRILLAGEGALLRITGSNGEWYDLTGGNSLIIPHHTAEFGIQGSGRGYLASVGMIE